MTIKKWLDGGDRTVCGNKDVKVKEKFLIEGSDLSLEKAINIARSYEIIQRKLDILNSKEDPNINAINPNPNK